MISRTPYSKVVDEIDQIWFEYQAFLMDSSKGTVNLSRVESLLKRMKKYPTVFEEKIKTLECFLKEGRFY